MQSAKFTAPRKLAQTQEGTLAKCDFSKADVEMGEDEAGSEDWSVETIDFSIDDLKEFFVGWLNEHGPGLFKQCMCEWTACVHCTASMKKVEIKP